MVLRPIYFLASVSAKHDFFIAALPDNSHNERREYYG